jgi:nitroreductase
MAVGTEYTPLPREETAMEFAEVVRKRRMVRHFTGEPVSIDTVERIVRNAQRAPSAGFSQGVSFVLVTDPGTRRQIAAIAEEDEGYVADGFDPFISEAPVQLVLCTSEAVYKERYQEPDKKPDPDAPEMEWPVPYWHTDAGCALMLLLLAAVDEGLAGAFVGATDTRALRDLLGIPSDVSPVGIVLIGHGAPDVRSPSLRRGRRPLDEVLHRERW